MNSFQVRKSVKAHQRRGTRLGTYKHNAIEVQIV